MAPNTNDAIEPLVTGNMPPPQAEPRKYKIVYISVIRMLYLHIAGFYGLYLAITTARWGTIITYYVQYVVAVIGVTAGAHRLWTHKSYKAKLPLEIILMLCNSLAFQDTVFTWVRNHRLHHKYSDTDADPHNASRGLFYSHIGWLMVRKHPEVIKRGKEINMSDIYNNPVLKFQKKYSIPLIGTICFILPTTISMYCWGESLNVAWHMTMLRYMVNLHAAFLVNSIAHKWGYKTYDKNILPTQTLIGTFITLGECFHNYHHVFPCDYRTAELGNNYLNFTTKVIDFFAWIGWAYDLKSVPEDLARKRMEKSGDGTDKWGWGKERSIDKDHVKCDVLCAKNE